MHSELHIRNALVASARSLIGVPWVHQGRTIYGIDCGGVPIYALHEVGISDFDVTGYGRRPKQDEFAEMFETAGSTRIHPSKMKHGDAVIMKVASFPGHCGVMASTHENGTGRPTFIHAYAPYKKVVESPYDEFWVTCTWGAYILPGVPISEE